MYICTDDDNDDDDVGPAHLLTMDGSRNTPPKPSNEFCMNNQSDRNIYICELACVRVSGSGSIANAKSPGPIIIYMWIHVSLNAFIKPSPFNI